MRLLRYIFVPWIIILVYSSFSAFLGPSGLYARRHLEAERLELSENQKALDRIHDDFQSTKDGLMYDNDTLAVFARQLGYGREGEEFIRIMGLSVAANANMPSGHALYAIEPSFVSDKMLKIIAIAAGAAIFLYLLIGDLFLLRGIGRE